MRAPTGKGGYIIMVKMIVSDLDQTLLHTEKFISPYTIAALQKCREKGILIAFATARSTQAAAQFTEMFQPDVFIGYGGALVFAGDKVINRFDIPAELSAHLIQDCLAESAVKTIMAINETDALMSRDDWPHADHAHYRLADFTKMKPTRFLKLSLYADDQAAVERIAARYPMLDMLRYSGEDLYRFANREALKWNAIQAVAAHYNISTGEIIAFGDDVNDLEMIANCGTGVAVSNAIESVKAAADVICPSNDDDGVACWLLENVLIDT
jgi:Cof subfamily protein (haloacid dehalogenase superfamily)